MLSLPSPPPRWCEGSCRRKTTKNKNGWPTFYKEREASSSRSLAALRTGMEKAWKSGRGMTRTEQIHSDKNSHASISTRQTWKGRKKKAGRQKETGKSLDGNPPRLFLPFLSSGYIKHIQNSVLCTSKSLHRFAICICDASRELQEDCVCVCVCVLQEFLESKISFFGEYLD